MVVISTIESSIQSPCVAEATRGVTQRWCPLSTPEFSTRTPSLDPSSLPSTLRHFVEDPDTGCWVWTGKITKSGYGQLVSLHGQDHSAHRAVYEALMGQVDHSIPIHHICRNRRCVNPAHLAPMKVHLHNRLSSHVVLTPEDVHRIRHMSLCTTANSHSIALALGVSRPAVDGVLDGRTWRSLHTTSNDLFRINCELDGQLSEAFRRCEQWYSQLRQDVDAILLRNGLLPVEEVDA